MPKPLTVCNERGCTVLTRTSYCVGHSRNKEVYRTRSELPRGTLVKWRKYTKQYRVDYPHCVDCGAPAEVTDHVIPHRGDMRLFWDANNHAPMCRSCHNRKTATADGGFGNYG